MELIAHHHHFKKDLIPPGDRVSLCERRVIDILLNSTVPDAQRENSIAWELKHHSGVTQMARLLARKRRLKIDVCTIGALLHDIYAIVHGQYKDHAHLGAPMAVEIINKVGGFAADETSLIHNIVYHHSDKEVWSNDFYQEFGKDADILDIFLYPGPFPEYLLVKSLPVFQHYLVRAKKIWTELGLPADPRFSLLDNYTKDWLQLETTLTIEQAINLLTILFYATDVPKEDGICPPVFCLLPKMHKQSKKILLYTNSNNWHSFLDRLQHIDPALPDFHWVNSLTGFKHNQLIEMKGNFFTPSKILSVNPGELIKKLVQKNNAMVFWPLADVYEIIEDLPLSTRLTELGIPC